MDASVEVRKGMIDRGKTKTAANYLLKNGNWMPLQIKVDENP